VSGEIRIANLIIIGAQKCGTTSLHQYLHLHPEVCMSTEKETNFFVWHYERGLEWYSRLWPEQAPILGESSPNYTVHPKSAGVPERIRAATPEAKLIYLVRDPVDRMISNYVHGVARGDLPDRPEEVLTAPDIAQKGLVLRGLYALQLEQYLAHFPQEQILVVDQRDLSRERLATLRRVFAFLGIDENFSTPAFEQRHLETSGQRRLREPLARRRSARAAAERLYRLPRPLGGAALRALSRPVAKPELDPALRARLGEHFAEDAARLRRITGQDFAHWSV
jgi:hypothetical protein